jgi:hypothetical protein
METAEAGKVRTMALPVKLSEKELSLRAQELASAEGTLDDAERRLDAFVEAAKGTKKEIETEIADARSSVHKLAQVVRDRKEDREVPIMEEPDYEAGAVNTFRTDTNEIVATRGMTPEERQRSLFQEKAKKRPS